MRPASILALFGWLANAAFFSTVSASTADVIPLNNPLTKAPLELHLSVPDDVYRPEVMTAAPPASRTLILKRSFFDDFDAFDLYDGKWSYRANRLNLPKDPENNINLRILNDQQAFYADPAFKGTANTALNLNPFSVSGSILSITAALLPDNVTPAQVGKTSSGRQYNFYSGQLRSWPHFAQKHGFFEVRAKVPDFKGAWPALWLVGLPYKDEYGRVVRWPEVGEIDFLEIVRGQIHQVVHYGSGDGSVHEVSGLGGITLEGFDQDFRNYGVLWTDTQVVFFIDRIPTSIVSLPGQLHQPMQLIMNLGIGGNWPGNVDPTELPASLEIDWVAAYNITTEQKTVSRPKHQFFLNGDFEKPFYPRIRLRNGAKFHRTSGFAHLTNGRQQKAAVEFPVQLPSGSWRIIVRFAEGTTKGNVAISDADGVVLIEKGNALSLNETFVLTQPSEIIVAVSSTARGKNRVVIIDEIRIVPGESN